MANIKFTRGELLTMLAIYEQINDCIIGRVAVKARKEKYLPKPNPDDTSAANRTRYEQYLVRAVFYNVTKRTLAGLCGQVFARDPEISIPTLLDHLFADIDGSGVSGTQLAKKTLKRVIAFGRAGLFTDFPTTDNNVSQEDLTLGRIRPVILGYDPWNIINWRTTEKDSLQILSLVVLRETYETADDGFEIKVKDQFRVLRLDNEGLYVVEIHRFDNEVVANLSVTGNIAIVNNVTQGVLLTAPALTQPGTVEAAVVKTLRPVDSTGERFDHIPFTFVGSENNDSEVDQPPMFDLSDLNIAHYRNSADYEEAVYIVGQPTPVMTGLTEDWVKDVLKGIVTLGSRAIIPLPENATAFLLQVAPNSMPFEAMTQKEKQMVAIGAQLITPSDVEKTATQSNLENASETSVVVSSAKNVTEAMEFALKEAALFVGATGQITFQLSTDFAFASMSPDARRQLVEEWVAGAIAFPELRSSLRKSGVATFKDDEAKRIIDTELKQREEAVQRAKETSGADNNNPNTN